MNVELASWSTLPREKYDTRTILMISHQVMGVSPELTHRGAKPYEVMLCYKEGNVLEQIEDELMSATLWEWQPIIISCTIVAPMQAVLIVEWMEAAHRVGIVDPHSTPTPDPPTLDRSSRINPEQEVQSKVD